MIPSRRWRLVLVILLAWLLAACENFVNSPGGKTVFQPPTLAAADAAISTQPPPSSVERATPTQTCTNQLNYIEDLSIPDGSPFPPGASLDKRWKVENSGTCNWDGRYRLQLTAGPALNAQAEQALYPARAGSQAEIRIEFKAPQEPGVYRSAWQAFDPSGQPFGDPVFIEIDVVQPTAYP
jgi:hypothetical protein